MQGELRAGCTDAKVYDDLLKDFTNLKAAQEKDLKFIQGIINGATRQPAKPKAKIGNDASTVAKTEV